jgi:hypothetical protein
MSDLCTGKLQIVDYLPSPSQYGPLHPVGEMVNNQHIKPRARVFCAGLASTVLITRGSPYHPYVTYYIPSVIGLC